NSFSDASAAASLLFEMNGSKQDTTSKERSDDPFSFPRQKRSVRPRLYLSIESDSEEER
nr:DNA-binding protein with MIZ/SP-RING zinc finger, PHD-finger and SAP domain-containing protein [Tanacetum cinerariifolium]